MRKIMFFIIIFCITNFVFSKHFIKVDVNKRFPLINGNLKSILWKIGQKCYDKKGKEKFVIETSSTLNRKLYHSGKMVDKDLRTCWSEGKKGYGKGEWIIFTGGAKFDILNGLWASKKLFYMNNRIKKLKITTYEIYGHRSLIIKGEFTDTTYVRGPMMLLYGPFKIAEKIITLPDGMRPIHIYVKFPYAMHKMVLKDNTKKVNTTITLHRLEILDVYKGTRYNDTCVTEITGANELSYGKFKR